MESSKIQILISELLYEHDCVIIPGFGGFVARNHPARLSSQSIFSPPSKSILFNRNLWNNDGLLANKIMNAASCNYEKANSLIQDFVKETLHTLDLKRRLEFYPIGFFFFNQENNLQFEASSDVNYLIDSFGLPHVLVKPLPEEEKKQNLVFKDRNARDLKIRKNKYRRVAALAIGLPLIATVFFLTGEKVGNKELSFADLNPFSSAEPAKYKPLFNTFDLSAFSSKKVGSNPTADSAGIIHYKIENNQGADVFVNIYDTTAIESTAVKNSENSLHKLENTNHFESGTFQVVVGCFANENNALKLVKKLRAQNFQSAVIGKNKKGLHVVSAGGYNTIQSAKEFSARIQSEFSGAWVLNKNNL